MSTDQPAPAPGPPPSLPVFALFEHNVYERDKDFMGLYPSPAAAMAYVAEHHGIGTSEWSTRPTIEGEPDIHVANIGHGFWQISQFSLERDGTPSFDEAVLHLARAVVARRFGLLIAGDLMRLLDSAAAAVNVNADNVP